MPCARLAGFTKAAVPLPTNTHRCKTCCSALPKTAFSTSQQKSTSNCMLCLEIGPVVEACLFNRCAYCKTVMYDPLTKEHVVPKAFGGTWSPRIACRTCNQQRGANMNYKAFEDMVARFPVVLDRAKKLPSAEWRWKNPHLAENAKNAIITILECASNHKTAVPAIVAFPNKK